MHIEVLHDPARVAALEADWGRLIDQSPTDSASVDRRPMRGPFLRFEWMWEWWRHFGATTPDARLQVIVARDAAQVVTGILPLWTAPSTPFGLRSTRNRDDRPAWMDHATVHRGRLLGAGPGGADHLDLLAVDGAVADALVRTALGLPMDVWDLHGIDPDGWLARLMRARSDRPDDGHWIEGPPCPYIDLSGDLTARIPRRTTLERRRRWLERLPGLSLRCDTDPAAIDTFLAHFRTLHVARWADDGGSQAFPDARLWAFHHAVLSRQAGQGRARLWQLGVAERPLAVVWAIDDGKRCVFYQSGFDPRWSARSPGAVLFARMVTDAAERGMTEVDLLHGEESYKSEWTRRSRRVGRLVVTPTSLGRRWWTAAEAWRTGREAVPRLLPEAWRRPVQRVVRARRMGLPLWRAWDHGNDSAHIEPTSAVPTDPSTNQSGRLSPAGDDVSSDPKEVA